MGRLFDAVAALVLGSARRSPMRRRRPVETEMLAIGARRDGSSAGYPFRWTHRGGLGRPAGTALPRAPRGYRPRRGPESAIARRFHASVVRLTAGLCRRIADETGLGVVALSRGCFRISPPPGRDRHRAARQELRVLLHHQVPANDGGLSLGQAVIAQQMGRG